MSTLEDFEAKLADLSVTRIDSDPTMHTYDRLFEELLPIAMKIKANLVPKGETYGFLAIICTDDEYGYYINDESYMYQPPTKPDDYDLTIPDNIGETQRKVREAQHRTKQVEYLKFTAMKNCLRDIIAKAIPEEYLEEIKDPVVGYDMLQPYDTLQHVRHNISLTTLDIDEMKATVYVEWIII